MPKVSPKTIWRWSQLLTAILMVIMEWLLRGIITSFFKLVPLSYCLNLLGIQQQPPQYTKEDEEMEMDTCEFIESRGFASESHFTTTTDGYVLGLQRIPPKHKTCADGADEASTEAHSRLPSRGVVLLIHGFMQSSESFTIRRDSSNSLPLVLANAGYDVWLGNNRGNKYSCKHASRKPANEDFWDFSLDEMIRYDMPSMIEYVLVQTKAESLTLIGFSQGTAQAFACMSSGPHLAKKVNLFIALAPVSEVRGFSNPVVDNLARARPDFIFLLFGKRSILPSTLFWRKILSRNVFVHTIDKAILFLFGWSAHCIDPAEKSLLYSHIYSFSSVKTVVHWFQIIQAAKFQMFDDCMANNVSSNPYDRYTTKALPHYRTMQLQCPVACFYGGRDNLPNTKAVLANIPKSRVVLLHKEEEYEHLDFMWAKDTGTKICPKVLDLLKEYNPVDL
jgi:lysosomal acid lipase/cholesteryl ester hydrolase